MQWIKRQSFIISLFIVTVLLIGAAIFAWADEANASKAPGESGQLGSTLVLSDEVVTSLNDSDGPLIQAASTSSVNKPSQDQIRNYVLSKRLAVNADPSFVSGKMPSVSAPGASGELDQSTLNTALTTLNRIRYIAGIQDNVVLDSTYNQQCQAGALVMAWNKVLDHYPARPNGISDSLFELGYAGTSNSNISSGLISSPAGSVIDGDNTLIFLPYTDGKAWLDRLYDQDHYIVNVSSTAKNTHHTYDVTFFNLSPLDELMLHDFNGSTIGTFSV